MGVFQSSSRSDTSEREPALEARVVLVLLLPSRARSDSYDHTRTEGAVHISAEVCVLSLSPADRQS